MRIIIKYNYLELYRKLKYAPSEILSSEEGGWNGKCWKYVVDDNKEEGKDYDSLLEILFPGKITNHDFDSIVGISNKEWTSLYFAEHLPEGFRDKNEYENCLKNNTFPEKVCFWAENQDKGLLFIIAAEFCRMKLHEVVTCLVEYMFGSMDKKETELREEEKIRGYTEVNVKHSYKRIFEFLNVNPILLLLFHQIFNDLTVVKDGIAPMDNIIQSTDRPLELIALMLGQLRKEEYIDDGDYPGLKYYISVLWERITSVFHNETEDTLDILEILHDCTLEDTFELFALPLIVSDPIRWLGATINVCEVEGNKKYLILKSHETHALFGRRDDVEYKLDEILGVADTKFQSYIKGYKSLFMSLKDVVTTRQISQFGLNFSRLEAKNNPILLNLKPIGREKPMLIGTIISERAKDEFWGNINLRIHRAESRIHNAF